MRSDLIAAYLRTLYRVQLQDGTIDLTIGERSPALDRLLEARGARRWAWLTAVNPGSELRPEPENRARLARLREEVAALGWVALDGVAVAPEGDWPDEPSLLVLEPDAERLRALGREHGQNACLAGERGGTPQLVLLTPAAPTAS